MTVEEIHELRKSFVQLESQADIGSLIFYRRLLELSPELGGELTYEIRTRGTLLFSALSSILGCLELDGTSASLENIRQELRDACGSAVLHRLTPQQLNAAEQAWMETLAAMLQRDFTPRVRDAWQALSRDIKQSLLTPVPRRDVSQKPNPGLTPGTRES